MPRSDGRSYGEMRPVVIDLGVSKYAEGSALIQVGDTKVFCTASVDEKVPPFLKGSGQGWITSEYGMLPRATPSRNQRDITRGRASGRSVEIGRLIGRALRGVVDMAALGERTIWIDCDVLQADGGTRTAAITGSFVALVECAAKIRRQCNIPKPFVKTFLAAISVGIVGGWSLLDLSYEEDSRAEVDMNVVMTSDGRVVEIQGTAEHEPFSRKQLLALLDLAQTGIEQLIGIQKTVLGSLVSEVQNH